MSIPLRVILLYSSGHVGSAIILDHLSRAQGVEIVGVVRAAPVRAGKKTLKKTS